MPTVESFDGTKIYYLKKKGDASKQAFLFIHGWVVNHTVWNPQMRHFSKKGHTVVALDMRGHGKSQSPSEKKKYALSCFAKDIAAIIRKEKLKKVVLVGHSMGGMIILKFMELFPKLAHKIVLVDSTFHNPVFDATYTRKWKWKLNNILRHVLDYVIARQHIQKKHFKEVDISKYKRHHDLFYWLKGARQTYLLSILACFEAMMDYDETKILSKIQIPTLIIEGEHDPDTPFDIAVKMKKKIKKSYLVVVKGAEHDVPMTDHRKLNKILGDFLEV